ncbi:hypothetical protein SCHPADRAFT_795760, partial [Schizopora paradoxa]
MALPAQIPTLQACNSKNLTRVDNVFVSEGAIQDVVYCNAHPEDRPMKTDHFPIRTIVDCSIPKAEEWPKRNFRAVEWADFIATLREALVVDGVQGEVFSIEELRQTYNKVMAAINTAVNAHVPFVKPSPYQKMWWSKELGVMVVQKRRMQRRAYR